MVEQHQGVYEQNSIEKIARFWKTEPTKDVDKRSFLFVQAYQGMECPRRTGPYFTSHSYTLISNLEFFNCNELILKVVFIKSVSVCRRFLFRQIFMADCFATLYKTILYEFGTFEGILQVPLQLS